MATAKSPSESAI